MKHYYPPFDEFRELVPRGNTIPVYRELLADALTPVTAYQRLAHPVGFAPASYAFLLESVVGGERIARYSFAAAEPEATFTATRDTITISRPGEEDQIITSHDPLGELSKMLEPYKAVHLPGLPRFTGGIVGYATYDMIRYYEALGEGPPDNRSLPDLAFGLYRTMVMFDHVVESSKVGCRKPEQRFYEIACELVGVEPSECVFLDDLGINLKPAKAMGMTTIKVGAAETAITELEQVLGIPLR